MPRPPKEDKDPDVVTMKSFMSTITEGRNYWQSSHEVKCNVVILAASLGATLSAALTLIGETGNDVFWEGAVKEHLKNAGASVPSSMSLDDFLGVYSQTRLLCVQMANATEKRDGNLLKFLGECILNQREGSAGMDFMGKGATYTSAMCFCSNCKNDE